MYPLAFVCEGWPLKEWMAGCAVGPALFIRAGYEKDEGLCRHELTHVRQFWTVAAVLCVINVPAAMALAGQLGAPWHPAGAAAMAVWLALIGHSALYALSREYRLAAEAQAYAVQTLYPDRHGQRLTLERAALLLAEGNRYKLDITPAEARAAIAARLPAQP